MELLREEKAASEKQVERAELDFLRQREESDMQREREAREDRVRQSQEMQALAREAIERKKAERERERHGDPSDNEGLRFGTDAAPRGPLPSREELTRSWKQQIDERARRRREEHPAHQQVPDDEPFVGGGGESDSTAVKLRRQELIVGLRQQMDDRRRQREAAKAQDRSVYADAEGLFGAEKDSCLMRCPATGRVLPPEAFNIPRGLNAFAV